jgi:pimeloyl-ACP methyl ester carboxylesterase
MGRYVDIVGHPTWVEELGDGPATVVLLHGGLSNSDSLIDAIGGPLADHFRVVAFDRRGHGRTADTDAPFHYDDMAAEATTILDEVVGGPAHLVGFSDGGIVSLLVSMRRPDLVTRQVLIGTNYHHDGLRPLELDPDSPIGAAMMAAYAERSPDGAEHFEIVLGKAITVFSSAPTLTVDDVRGVSAPTLVMVGDDDLVELGHTVSLYEALPAGQLAVVPRTSHTLPLEEPAEVARLVIEFLTSDEPPQTMMPSRRAHR